MEDDVQLTVPEQKKAGKKAKDKRNYSVADHYLVPKHSLLNDKEKKAVLEQYHVMFSELPKILITDPALSGMDVKIDDVIKITKEHPQLGKMEYYRGVANE